MEDDLDLVYAHEVFGVLFFCRDGLRREAEREGDCCGQNKTYGAADRCRCRKML
jgi:hypothetical protein